MGSDGGSGDTTDSGVDDGGSGEPVGEGATDGGATDVSNCGAPLDITAPTAASIVNDGPMAVMSYSTGLPASPAYKSQTVY
jgi:hypothetical protein